MGPIKLYINDVDIATEAAKSAIALSRQALSPHVPLPRLGARALRSCSWFRRFRRHRGRYHPSTHQRQHRRARQRDSEEPVHPQQSPTQHFTIADDIPLEVVGDDYCPDAIPGAVEQVCLQGDWRTLPESSWRIIHDQFPRPVPARLAALRTRVSAEPLPVEFGARKEAVLALVEHDLHELPRTKPYSNDWNSWAHIHKFRRTWLHDALCEHFHGGTRDPRCKSDEYIQYYSGLLDIFNI